MECCRFCESTSDTHPAVTDTGVPRVMPSSRRRSPICSGARINEAGTIQPITELAAAVHECSSVVHTDAAQSVGKVPVLIEHFFEQSRRRHPSSVVKHLSIEVSQRLLDHDWPGNVRELEHVIERLVLLGRAAEVGPGDLPPTVGKRRATHDFSGEVVPLREMSRRYAQWAFGALDGRKLETAEMLDVDVKTLTKLLRNDGESKP